MNYENYFSTNNKDTSIAIFKKGSNVLQIPYRKSDNDYNKGYNAALKKCNVRATKIMKRMMVAYQKALEEEDDDDDYQLKFNNIIYFK